MDSGRHSSKEKFFFIPLIFNFKGLVQGGASRQEWEAEGEGLLG